MNDIQDKLRELQQFTLEWQRLLIVRNIREAHMMAQLYFVQREIEMAQNRWQGALLAIKRGDFGYALCLIRAAYHAVRSAQDIVEGGL